MDDFFFLVPSTTTLLCTFGILLILYLLFSHFDHQRNEPPGPWPLPVFGNLLSLDPKSPHTTFYQLSKKYGPVFTFHFGPQKMVVLAGHKIIKQGLVNTDAFAEREAPPIIKDLNLTHGIVFANGESWKEMRNFAVANMKDFGMGKKACEEKIIVESQCLIEEFMKQNGKAFDTSLSVNYAVSNIICSLLYGSRFEYDDPVFLSMVDRFLKNTQLMGSFSTQLYNLFPRLFKWLGVRDQLLENAFANRKHMKEQIKSLQDTLNPQMCRGVFDSFLARKIHHEASGNMNSHYHEDNLLVTGVNLFAAGTDTSASTIRYGLLLMAKYPKVQERVQEEMNRVVGSRQVRAEDRKNLPYTDAVIHEIQRMADAVPTVLHRTARDVNFQGYFIKKGTPALILLSSALHDEDEWETPYTFNPGHFLNEDGARVCAGESLARMEVFLFFTSLLQHFCFTPPPGVKEDELDLTHVVGFTQTPVPHKLCAISRV